MLYEDVVFTREDEVKACSCGAIREAINHVTACDAFWIVNSENFDRWKRVASAFHKTV